MVDLERLKVSLTKNGYLKIADVLKRHPRWEVLDNISGVYPGINLARSQAANIMGADVAGNPPEFWDEIRSYGERAIDAFTLIAIIFSHVDLIRLLKASAQGNMKGQLRRGQIGDKAYTNLVFAMASCDLCDYERGADAVTYDMRGLVHALRGAGDVVQKLLEFKLRKCGWRPAEWGGTDFLAECEENEIHRVFGLEPREFRSWMRNRLRVAPPITGPTPRYPR